jgi:hypothetical protein
MAIPSPFLDETGIEGVVEDGHLVDQDIQSQEAVWNIYRDSGVILGINKL